MNKLFDGYILVSDMDGTLLSSNKEISDNNLKAIKRFQSLGGKFTLATGRTVDSVKQYMDKLTIDAPLVLYNGAKIYDFNKKATLLEIFLPEKTKEIVRKINRHYGKLGIEIYSNEKIYVYQSCFLTKRLENKGFAIQYGVPKEGWQEEWTKVLIVGTKESLDYIEEIFTAEFEKMNLVRTGETYLEILPNSTTKGSGVKKMCEIVGIDMSKVIAVGDEMNDYEMINEAGYGFGVSSGNEKFLSICRLICNSNDEDAIEDVVNWAIKNIK